VGFLGESPYWTLILLLFTAFTFHTMPLQTVAAISSYVVETLIEAVVSCYDHRDHTLAADGYGAYPTNQEVGIFDHLVFVSN